MHDRQDEMYSEGREMMANATRAMNTGAFRAKIIAMLAEAKDDSGKILQIKREALSGCDLWPGSQACIEAVTDCDKALARLTKADGPDQQRTKPMVFFSNNYLDVTCTIWKKSESRKRARQANNILRRLYSNWEKGNKPIPLKELLRGVNTERLDIALSKRNYPQTFSLIRIQTNEKNGCRTAHLSDEYAFTAS